MRDAEIVRLFTERDESAVSAAVAKYRGYCLKIALNILGSAEDAEECVNSVFLKAWEMIPPHSPENLSAFLGKLARTTAINMKRDSSAQKRGGDEVELVYDELSEIASGGLSGSSGSSVERTAENRELIAEINEFLKKQPEPKRSLFICRYFYCDSVREIAANFLMTQNNVSVTLNRTRKKLCEHLRKRGFDL